MSDKIILRGANFHGRHGVSAEERAVGGRYVVDVELELDLARAGSSDRIEDTVSYSHVFKAVRAVVEEEHFQLLEKLGQKIADVILERFPAQAVTVYVRKEPAPIRGILESAGVEIRRGR